MGMTPEGALAEVLKSLAACRERMAGIHKLTSNTDHRRDLLAVDMAHELELLKLVAALSAGHVPEVAISNWERLRKPSV
jgi:hypothetical protein